MERVEFYELSSFHNKNFHHQTMNASKPQYSGQRLKEMTTKRATASLSHISNRLNKWLGMEKVTTSQR